MVNNRQYTQASVTVCEICPQFCHCFVRIQNNAISFPFLLVSWPGVECTETQSLHVHWQLPQVQKAQMLEWEEGGGGGVWGEESRKQKCVAKVCHHWHSIPVFVTTDNTASWHGYFLPPSSPQSSQTDWRFSHPLPLRLSCFTTRKKETNGSGDNADCQSQQRCQWGTAAAAAGDCVVLVQRGDEEQDLLVEVGQLARGLLPLLHHAADVHQHRVALCALPLSKHTKQRPNHTPLMASGVRRLCSSAQHLPS